MFHKDEIVDNTYQIIGEIGVGGTGIVFQAYHLRLKKYVVLKKIKDNFVNSINVRSEVDILKKLHHKYLPQVYDFVRRGNEVYTVIDYIDGYDLEYYMENGYSFTEEMLIRWLKQLCDVLDYLHKQSPTILHSDIKPGNIMITTQGDVCLIDFNISLDNDVSSTISGLSQYYAAPEQLQKAMAVTNHQDSSHIQLDERMDIYSLGATFYYLLTGTRPSLNYEEIYPIQSMELPYRYGLLCVIQKAMSYWKEERYQSAEEMLKAINDLRKQDTKYKVYQVAKYGSFVAYALLMALGVLLCVSGVNKNTWSQYNKDMQIFGNMYEAGNNSESIQKGLEILNNRSYDKIMKTNGNEAELCYRIGDCYYYGENYDGAVQYYKLAYEKNPEKSDEKYFRDYAVALVKQGEENIPIAEGILNEAKVTTQNLVGIEIVEAQIDQADKNYQEAIQKANEIIRKESASNEEKYMAYVILAEVYEQKQDYTNAITMRENAYGYDSTNKNNVRKLAKAYGTRVANYTDQQSQSSKNLCTYAEKYYWELVNCEYPVLEDEINYAVICRVLDDKKKLENAKMLLENAKEINKDYRIELNLAYIYMKLGDVARARTNCQKAAGMYQKELDTNGKDEKDLRSLQQELGG